MIYTYAFQQLARQSALRDGPPVVWQGDGTSLPGLFSIPGGDQYQPSGNANTTAQAWYYTNHETPITISNPATYYNGGNTATLASPLTLGRLRPTGYLAGGGAYVLTYQPTAIECDGVAFTQEKYSFQLKVTVKNTAAAPNPVAQLFLANPPDEPVYLTVWAQETIGDQPVSIFTGRVRGVTFKEGTAEMLCTSLQEVLQRPGLGRDFSRQCPYILYDSKTCGVTPSTDGLSGPTWGHNSTTCVAKLTFVSDDFLTLKADEFAQLPVLTSLPAVTIDAPGGSSSAASASSATFPRHFLTGGFITHTKGAFQTSGATPGLPGYIIQNYRRFVRSHSGDTVVLMTPLPTVSVGDTVVGFRGCTHTIDVCHGVFNNSSHFGGWPQIPGANPFVDGLLATK